MPLPNFVAQTDIFFTWLDATNNLTSHVDNTSAYLLVAQNATPRTSSGNIALSGTFTLGTTVLNTSALVANGNFLTTLNASAITTGTLPLARLNSNVILTTSTTGMNASALSTGTVPNARLDATVLLTTSTTGINASALSTGTVPLARLDANVLLTTSTTGINASALSTGIVPTARLTSASVTDTGVVTTTTQSFAGNKTFVNSVTISGNLNVLGTTTTVSANNLIVDDSLIQLAANNTTSDLLDIGLYGNYNGDGGAHEHTGLFRDATDGLWKLFVGLQDGPTSTINTSGVGYAIGTIQTYLTSGGVVANSSGLTVTANSSYSGTLTVNTVTAQTLTGNLTGTASNATNLNSQPGSFYTNASNLNTGTVPIARLDANVILTTSTTGINASALSTGIVPNARLDANVLLTTSTTGINASALSTGTVPVARLDSSVILTTSTTGINASALSTGTVPLARLTSANSSANGVVDTNAQTFAGNKTFQNATTFSNTVSISGAANALSTLGVTGTFTALGQMVVGANANFDSGVLFVDSINNRVGINNTAPTTALEVTGTVTATTFSGSGASLTALNASNLSTGTVPNARLDANVLLTTSTTGINASALSTGTVPVGRLDSSVLLTTSTTGINASALSTGTVPVARLSSANTTAAGVVDTTTQSFAGNKTFQNAATFSSTVSVSGAVNALSTLGVTGTLTALGQLSVTGNATFDTNTLFVDATNDTVGMGTTETSSESNLFLGARGTDEGGQITLQRATNRTTAFSWDNYQDTLRVLTGTNTISNAAIFSITATGNTSISGTLNVTGAVNALSTLGVTGTLSALGQLAVSANAAFDTNVLFVDAVNNRVGVNNSGPTTALDVTGTVTATTFSGSGASLTTLNASVLSTGTVPVARLDSSVILTTSTTGINASALSVGTVPIGRLDSSVILTTTTTGINASALSVGTVPVGRLDSSVLLTTSTTGINASALSTGTVPVARLSSANTTAAGVVDTTTQSFAGNKTFTNDVAVNGTITGNLTGTASNATNLNSQPGTFYTNASNLNTGTVPVGRLDSSVILTTSTTGINASALSTGTVPVGRLDSSVLLTTSTTGINASALSVGTVPVARLDSSVLLTTSTTGINASAISTGSLSYARLATTTAGNLLMGNSSGGVQGLAMTGDVTITSAGVTAIGSGKVTSAMIVDGTIVDGDINASAAIAYSKLSLANSIVNADISSSAAIAVSKLAASTISGITLGNNLNAATFNNAGAGAASGSTYNGSSALTVSYNTVGAPSTGGTGATGTWGISISGTASNATNLNSQPGSFYTNASNITTGTLPVAQLNANVILTTSTTGINASALSVGTVPVARLDSSVLLTTSTTGINASALSVGTVPVARLDSSVILTTSTTGINASALSTGTVPVARLSSANTSAAGVVDTTTQTFAGDKTFQNTVILQSALTANSGNGSAGQVLTSSGTGVYWANASAGAAANTAGGTGALQFYNGTTLGADANLAFLTNTLTVNGGMTVAANANFNGGTLFVDTVNNRVGIGNTAPGSRLVVSDAGNYQLGITGTSATAYTQLYLNGTNRAYGVGVGGGSETAYGVPDEFFIFDHTAAAMRLVLDTNGNVGLGNTSPAHKLRVEGTTSISGALNALSTFAVTGATTLSSTLGVTGVATFSANANFDSGVLFVDGTNNRVGVNNAAPSQAFRVDGTTSLNGNVAIGTTNTSAFALLVEGSFAATTKEFNIAHPTRPGKRLRYGVLESPYHGVRLTGRAELTGTEVEVPLPEYLSALCTDVGSQVQLTNHGHDKVLWVDRIDLARNCFVVRMRRRWWDRTTYAFYWAFTGIRQDVEPLDVEPE